MYEESKPPCVSLNKTWTLRLLKRLAKWRDGRSVHTWLIQPGRARTCHANGKTKRKALQVQALNVALADALLTFQLLITDSVMENLLTWGCFFFPQAELSPFMHPHITLLPNWLPSLYFVLMDGEKKNPRKIYLAERR